MANITRFDPLGEMVTLRQAMDRLFEDSFVSPLSWRGMDGEGVNAPLDVHQTADEIVVTASLPGVKPEDVEITMTGQTLTVRGEVKADERIEREQYLYRERRHGTFSRTLQLPVRVEGDKADAQFSDGVLTLRIPKAEEVKPRQIQIRPGNAQIASGRKAASPPAASPDGMETPGRPLVRG
jgi:HSP20 family protein